MNLPLNYGKQTAVSDLRGIKLKRATKFKFSGNFVDVLKCYSKVILSRQMRVMMTLKMWWRRFSLTGLKRIFAFNERTKSMFIRAMKTI